VVLRPTSDGRRAPPALSSLELGHGGGARRRLLHPTSDGGRAPPALSPRPRPARPQSMEVRSGGGGMARGCPPARLVVELPCLLLGREQPAGPCSRRIELLLRAVELRPSSSQPAPLVQPPLARQWRGAGTRGGARWPTSSASPRRRPEAGELQRGGVGRRRSSAAVGTAREETVGARAQHFSVSPLSLLI
jgi:hypothetical protein